MPDVEKKPSRRDLNAERFWALLNEMNSFIPNAQQVPDMDRTKPMTMIIEHDGIPFLIAFDGDRNPNVLTVVCELGPAPQDPDIQLAAYTRVLEVNSLLQVNQGGTMGLRPDTAELVFMCDIPMKDIGLEKLVTVLMGLVEQARAWRNTAFGTMGVQPPEPEGSNTWTRA